MIKKVVDGNIKVHSKTKLDVVRFEYGQIVNSSEILNSIDEIDNVFNQSHGETGHDIKLRKYNIMFSLMIR